ncbi:unnamed protein product [Oikopleura dioica]|uniref:Uncharacterized protein n=1 Tax=Oikopleura dioica TaxID=34765 RepID=E4Y4V6_OIKDI|nr:unnamed protein product [Oikopleura dioica]
MHPDITTFCCSYPQNSVECLKLCGTTPVTPLPKDHIAIFTRPALASYLINKEGTTSSGPQITGPSDRFIRSKSAIIANIPYMFGGIVKPRRIAYLDSCAFVELNVELNNDYYDSHAALAYNAGSNALICFGNADNAYNYCSDFDGTTVRTRPSTTYSHRYGGLGFYGGTPITVGSYYPDGNKKCEVFHGSGWTTLDNDHPSDVYGHSLVGLENGHVLLIGGVDNNGWHNTIWRMRGGQTGWESYGSIQEAVRGASTIILDKSIFVIGGSNRDYYPYQRVDLTEDGSFEKSALLGYNHLNGWEPLLLIVDANFCSAS